MPYGQTDAVEKPFRHIACAALALALTGVMLPSAAAAGQEQVKHEIIPGSELMTSQERERYRLRLRNAGSAEESERLRAEHVRAMEERARLRGLKLIDYSRQKQTP